VSDNLRVLMALKNQLPTEKQPLVDELIASTPDATAPVELVGYTAKAFCKRKLKQREVLLESKEAVMMRHPSINEIHAYRGTGKTNVAVHLLNTIANGGDFFRWSCKTKKKVLYVEGEQPAVDLQETIRDLAEKDSTNFHIMTLEDQTGGKLPKIVDPVGQAAYEAYIKEHGIEVVVFDSLSTLANVSMNEEDEQLAIGDWFIRLRTVLKVSVIYLQHDGKGGSQRGHSKHEDWIDLSVQLKWTDETVCGALGLDCTFHFDKVRKPIKDGKDFRIMLRDNKWEYSDSTVDEDKRTKCLKYAIETLLKEPEYKNEQVYRVLRSSGAGMKKMVMKEVVQEARDFLAEKEKAA